LYCYIDKRIAYSSSGKATEETYGPDEDDEEAEDYVYDTFVINYSDFNKGEGTILFNNETFYKESSSAELNGTWCTYKDIDGIVPQIPDTGNEQARGSVMANYKKSVTWLKFDASKREFVWVEWRPGEGLLTKKGSFKTLSEAQVVLEGITGTFYNGAGELVFKDEAFEGQSEARSYRDSLTSLFFEGAGSLHKSTPLK